MSTLGLDEDIPQEQDKQQIKDAWEAAKKRETQAQTEPTVVNVPAIGFDCTICKSSRTMTGKTIGRMTIPVRVMGGIILVASFIVFGIAILNLLLFFLRVASMNPSTDAELSSVGLGFALVSSSSIAIAVFAFFGALLGFLLTMTRKVFWCTSCGHLFFS